MNKGEKDKGRSIKQSFKAKEKEMILATLPISLNVLKELFDWLDAKLETENCDNTFKHTQIFLKQNNLLVEESLEWLKNQGGYCDCEVSGNVSELAEN